MKRRGRAGGYSRGTAGGSGQQCSGTAQSVSNGLRDRVASAAGMAGAEAITRMTCQTWSRWARILMCTSEMVIGCC